MNQFNALNRKLWMSSIFPTSLRLKDEEGKKKKKQKRTQIMNVSKMATV